MDCSASCCATRPTVTQQPRRAKGDGEQERASNGALHFETKNEYYTGSEIDEGHSEGSAPVHLAGGREWYHAHWRAHRLATRSSSKCQHSLADDKWSDQCGRSQGLSQQAEH